MDPKSLVSPGTDPLLASETRKLFGSLWFAENSLANIAIAIENGLLADLAVDLPLKIMVISSSQTVT